RGDGKIQIAESPVAAEAPTLPSQQSIDNTEEPVGFDGNGSHSLDTRPAESQPPWKLPASGHCTRIDLSDGRRAEFNIPDRLRARDSQKLQKALDGIKVIIESMVSEEK